MRQLAKVSNLSLQDLDDAARRETALDVFNDLHNAIYGKIGVLASTATRETILCARKRCMAYSKDQCEYPDMLNAVWAVHQMLRSDLNHHQDRLTREFDRVRNKHGKNITADVIEWIIAEMPHVQFGASPNTNALKSWKVRWHAKRLIR